jgi:hypothetical protein
MQSKKLKSKQQERGTSKRLNGIFTVYKEKPAEMKKNTTPPQNSFEHLKRPSSLFFTQHFSHNISVFEYICTFTIWLTHLHLKK